MAGTLPVTVPPARAARGAIVGSRSARPAPPGPARRSASG